jgi:hypothetical protein
MVTKHASVCAPSGIKSNTKTYVKEIGYQVDSFDRHVYFVLINGPITFPFKSIGRELLNLFLLERKQKMLTLVVLHTQSHIHT